MAEYSSRGRQKRESDKQPSNNSDDYKLRRQSKLDHPPINQEEPAQHTTSADTVHNVRRKRDSLARKENSERCDETAAAASTQIQGCKSQHRRRGHSRGNTRKQPSSEKPATILSWLIDSKIVEEDEEVIIISSKGATKGNIKKEGILCCCCSKILTAEEFHVHSGGGTSSPDQKPYGRILVAGSQKSLLSCMKEALLCHPSEHESQEITFNSTGAEDGHDSVCILCAIDGDLLCCDNCSSTYHLSCLDIAEVPVGSWYCPYCICKLCGETNENLMNKCHQCGKNYHLNCWQELEQSQFDLNMVSDAFCCDQDCMEVSVKLEKTLIGVKKELEQGYSWTLLRQLDHQHGVYINEDYHRTICHSKLAVAQRLMEDCFEPIFDNYTKINVIKNVIHNCSSHFNRIDFNGFYTVVLETNDQIVCVAALRIHDKMLAEMPFIATHMAHRCKGMCRKLMVAIESALCFLNVQKLIIPSTPQKMENWKQKFGFNVLDDETKNQLRNYNTLMFHDSIRLQKILLPCNSTAAS